MKRNAKPIILGKQEVRELVDRGEVLLRRRVSSSRYRERRNRRHVGDVLWVRESFAARLDGDRLKVRYTADGPNGEPRWFAVGAAFPTFRTATYVTHPAEYLPRAMARLVVDVAAVAAETEDRHPVEVLTLRLQPSGHDKRKGNS